MCQIFIRNFNTLLQVLLRSEDKILVVNFERLVLLDIMLKKIHKMFKIYGNTVNPINKSIYQPIAYTLLSFEQSCDFFFKLTQSV